MGLLDTFGQRVGVDGETMVHRDDFDLAGRVVLHRMVGAVVTLMHLLGPAAERQRQHLVTEADAEHRDVGLQQILDHRHGIFAGRLRVAGTVGKEDAVRLHGQDFFRAGLGRHDGDLGAETGEQAQDVALDAIVDRHHVQRRRVLFAKTLVPGPGRLAPDRGLARGDFLGEVQPDQTRPGSGAALQVVKVEDAIGRVGNDGVGHAFLTDQHCESASVDTRKRDDAALL